jgi:ABC-type transport system involved in cytochrome c biogenesis permease subunit
MKESYLFLVVLSIAFYVFGYYRMFFVWTGLVLQLVYIFSRGIQLDRLPLVGPHDTLLFLSVSTIVFALPIATQVKNRQRFLHMSVALTVFFAFMALLYKPHNFPLPPVLRTFWFETHVAFSFFSYALFGLAALLGIRFLFSQEEALETLQYKAILVGYCFFSVGMVFGGIWAYLAWGTYWLWTPKELWTVILWLFYGLYLHARLRTWWSGRPSVILGIIGFAIVMFTYLGVSLFMKSSHTF